MKESVVHGLLGVAVFLYSTFAFIFAQATVPLDGIPAWIKELSAVGALVWYLWYSQAISLPRIVDKHAEAQEKITNAFRHEQAETRLAHEKTTKLLVDSVRLPEREKPSGHG